MEGFDSLATELLRQIAEAYFNSGEAFEDDDADLIAAVIRAHAEDYEEDDKVAEVIVLRIVAEYLDKFGDVRRSHRERLEAGRGALALVRLYRSAQ